MEGVDGEVTWNPEEETTARIIVSSSERTDGCVQNREEFSGPERSVSDVVEPVVVGRPIRSEGEGVVVNAVPVSGRIIRDAVERPDVARVVNSGGMWVCIRFDIRDERIADIWACNGCGGNEDVENS